MLHRTQRHQLLDKPNLIAMHVITQRHIITQMNEGESKNCGCGCGCIMVSPSKYSNNATMVLNCGCDRIVVSRKIIALHCGCKL